MDKNIYYIMTAQDQIERIYSIQDALSNATEGAYVVCDQGPGDRMVWASGRNIGDVLRTMTHSSQECRIEKIIHDFLLMDFIYWSINPATERLHQYVSNFPKGTCQWPQCCVDESGLADTGVTKFDAIMEQDIWLVKH